MNQVEIKMQKKKISFSLFLLAMKLYCLKMWSLIYQHSVDNTIAIKAIRNIRNPLAFSNLSTFLLDRFKSAPWLFFSDSPFIWTKLRHYLSQYRLIKWAWLFHSCFSMHRVTTLCFIWWFSGFWTLLYNNFSIFL